jgi:hypothetical protein
VQVLGDPFKGLDVGDFNPRLLNRAKPSLSELSATVLNALSMPKRAKT